MSPSARVSICVRGRALSRSSSAARDQAGDIEGGGEDVDWLEAVVYGVVQGLTEYLPVSSSAHLALIPWITGWTPPSFAFDVLVQLGTLGAVCVYLRDDLKKIFTAVFKGILARKPFEDPWAKQGWLIVAATIPAVVIGLFAKDIVEAAFTNPQQVLVQLFGTGLLLILAETLLRRRTTPPSSLSSMSWGGALLVGLAQAFAILPGISRSGATISGAMVLGLDRHAAGRFSFLMSIPVMIGAGVLGLKDLVEKPHALDVEGPALVVAFIAAALVGFAVIRWFLEFVKGHSLYGFAAYCCTVSVAGLIAMYLART
jgi:undecaprenyl-diphosphatase